MKKMFFALVMMLTTSLAASAMSYEQARNEALFLTDKMAYELNLTDEQYEAVYEINLDYLMGVTGRTNVFGTYWERRNLDLSYILLDWQWNAFVAATYFYRPLYWDAGYWHFSIYRRYPHRDYFYFGRPHFYATYHGGHAWHVHGGRGYYYSRTHVYRAPHREHFGLHDRWNRGDFHGPRHSSTRITGPDHRGRDHREMNRGIENRSERSIERGSGNFSGYRGSTSSRNFGNRENTPSRNFGNSNHSTPSRSFGNNGQSTPSRSFGNSSPSRNFGNSTPSRSFGGSSHSSGSHSGFSRGGGSSSSGSHGGGSNGGGGSHFGGRR